METDLTTREDPILLAVKPLAVAKPKQGGRLDAENHGMGTMGEEGMGST